MFRRAVMYRMMLAVVGLGLIAVIAVPIYAHCGKCSHDAKMQADGLGKHKMTLAMAATLAEVNTKGTAVRAMVHLHGDNPFIEVHCAAKGKIMAVEIDHMGKVVASKDVKTLDAHARTESERQAQYGSPQPRKPGEPQPTESQLIQKSQLMLNQTNDAIKKGDLAKAEKHLNELESIRSKLPYSMQKQIDMTRQSFDKAKKASGK